jgi:hypothetical protein
MQQCLQAAIPQESKATCHDCAMCSTGKEEPSDDAVFFDPDSKCCTYMPTLWNFLVGAILEDDSPEAAEGRGTVEARIDASVAVTPLGLGSPPVYRLMYSRIQSAFGKAQSMRCPHYIEEGGRCGVWRNRESTCVTWFCKYERGAVGEEFWERLHQLLAIVESGLSTWCMLQLDPGEDALRSLVPPPRARTPDPISAASFDQRADPQIYRRNWGRWLGKEREFFRRAGQLARPLSWSKVLELGGAEAQQAEALVQGAFRRLISADLPERVRAGPINLTPDPDGGALVTTYNDYDPLKLSAALLGILPLFNGQPTSAAIASIRETRGVSVSPSLIRRLVDFGVLVDAE